MGCALHEEPNPIYHRDLKPGNVLVFEPWTLKIGDLGLARLAVRDTTKLTSTKRAGMGTYGYMAPEQQRSAADVDARSDIYSLGVVMYELLTGDPDFAVGGIDRVPYPYNSLLRRMLSPDRDLRYHSVADLLVDYERKLAALAPIRTLQEMEVLVQEVQAHPTRLGALIDTLEANNHDAVTTYKTLDGISEDALEKVAQEDLGTLHRIAALYGDAISEIMTGFFPYELMNGWTDFLVTIYGMAERRETKSLCLDRLAYMACRQRQFYTQGRLRALLESIEEEADVDLAIEVLVETGCHLYSRRSLRSPPLHPRLRVLLSD